MNSRSLMNSRTSLLRSAALAALSLAAFAAAHPASAQTVGNAGFEAPNLDGGYKYASDLVDAAPKFTPAEEAQTVWAFHGDSGISGNGSAFTAGNPNAPEGQQVAVLQSLGFFSQDISGFAAGSYSFSFQAAQRGNYQNGGQDFAVLLDNTVLGVFAPTSTSYETLTTLAAPVTAGTHTLTFRGLDTVGGDNTAFIDGVTVSPAAVPEASTTASLGLMLALGLGGLAVARKKSVKA